MKKKFSSLTFEEMKNLWEEYKQSREEPHFDDKGKIKYINKLPLYKKGFARSLGYRPKYFDEWADSKDNAYNLKKHKQFFELMTYDCEEYLTDKVITKDGIGAIFMLKSNYGYIEAEKQKELEIKEKELNHRIEIDNKKIEQDKDRENLLINVVKDERF